MSSSTHHFKNQPIPPASLEPSSSHASNEATSPCEAVLIPLLPIFPTHQSALTSETFNTTLSPHSCCHHLFPPHKQPFSHICCTCGDKPFRGITKCSMYHAHSHKSQHAHAMNPLPPHKDRDDFPILQHPTDPVLSHPQLPLSLLCSSHRSCGEDEQKNALTHSEDPLALPLFTLADVHMQL